MQFMLLYHTILLYYRLVTSVFGFNTEVSLHKAKQTLTKPTLDKTSLLVSIVPLPYQGVC